MVKLFLKFDQNGGYIARKLGAWATPDQTNVTSILPRDAMHKRGLC